MNYADKLIIRRSKNANISLTMNSEKVYRVFHDGKEILNTLDYSEASDKFNEVEERVKWFLE